MVRHQHCHVLVIRPWGQAAHGGAGTYHVYKQLASSPTLNSEGQNDQPDQHLPGSPSIGSSSAVWERGLLTPGCGCACRSRTRSSCPRSSCACACACAFSGARGSRARSRRARRWAGGFGGTALDRGACSRRGRVVAPAGSSALSNPSTYLVHGTAEIILQCLARLHWVVCITVPMD